MGARPCLGWSSDAQQTDQESKGSMMRGLGVKRIPPGLMQHLALLSTFSTLASYPASGLCHSVCWHLPQTEISSAYRPPNSAPHHNHICTLWLGPPLDRLPYSAEAGGLEETLSKSSLMGGKIDKEHAVFWCFRTA